MPKFLMECGECKNRFKTKKPHTRRICPVCKIETDFEIVEKPVKTLGKKDSFHIMCCRCQTRFYIKNGILPKKCPECKHPFKHHSENITLTDVIYNIITGSDSKDKGFLRVEIGQDGFAWWKGNKDAYDDEVCPFIGDAMSPSQGGFQGEPGLEVLILDDLRPVNFPFRKRR